MTDDETVERLAEIAWRTWATSPPDTRPSLLSSWPLETQERWRAVARAMLTHVPVITTHLPEHDTFVEALAELEGACSSLLNYLVERRTKRQADEPH